MAPASSSSAVKTLNKPKKRRFTREHLLGLLEVIGDLGAPLPSTLPPSPPASRAASPAAGFKRKHDSTSDLDAAKRPRTTVPQERPQSRRQTLPSQQSSQPTPHQQPSQSIPPSVPSRQVAPTPHSASRSEPCEDGEVREEPAVVPSVAPGETTIEYPFRRPRKGKPPLTYFDELHDKYHKAGRVLKYSGDARWWSSYAPSHKEYRPLTKPPPPNSSYHKHSGLIARLELLDALICFTYSIWTKEYPRRCCITETWSTIEAFLVWCKQKWSLEEGASDAERAFLGLIWMIEAFIQGRKMIYDVRGHLDSDMDKVHGSLSKKISAAATTALEGDPNLAATFGIVGKPPPMLPSPSSTNSTPVNRDGSTPTTNSSSNPSRLIQAVPHTSSRQQAASYTGSVPFKLLPRFLRDSSSSIPPYVMNSMQNVKEPVGPQLVQNLKDLTTVFSATAYCTQVSQTTLNLPLLRRTFPKTWGRMMFTTLLPTEEHEPDFEDEEGELYWPEQCINGEGIGWVCLMGKAMIKEFGNAYGYMGLDGVVPKPEPKSKQEENSNSGDGHPQHQSQRSGYSSAHVAQPQRPVAR